MKFNGKARSARRVLQQGHGPLRLNSIFDRDGIEQEVQHRMANIVHRQIVLRADDQLVVVAIIAEIGIAACQQFHINGKRSRIVGFQDFTKIAGNLQCQFRNGRAISFHAAIVFRLVMLPEQVQLRFAIEIGQNFVKPFEGQRIRRQIFAPKFEFEFRRRPRCQGEGDES